MIQSLQVIAGLLLMGTAVTGLLRTSVRNDGFFPSGAGKGIGLLRQLRLLAKTGYFVITRNKTGKVTLIFQRHCEALRAVATQQP